MEDLSIRLQHMERLVGNHSHANAPRQIVTENDLTQITRKLMEPFQQTICELNQKLEPMEELINDILEIKILSANIHRFFNRLDEPIDEKLPRKQQQKLDIEKRVKAEKLIIVKRLSQS